MENYLNLISVPAIATVVYCIINALKYAFKNNETFLRLVPILSLTLGTICGVIAFYTVPSIIPAENVIVAIVIGGASGLTATGCNQIFKQLSKGSKVENDNK